MNVFATVKTSIHTREAAARYGVEVNHHYRENLRTQIDCVKKRSDEEPTTHPNNQDPWQTSPAGRTCAPPLLTVLTATSHFYIKFLLRFFQKADVLTPAGGMLLLPPKPDGNASSSGTALPC